MKRLGLISLIVVLTCFGDNLIAQAKKTYKSNGTTYYYNETYKTSGKPKVDRSSSSKTEFLKSKGYKKIPGGYQIDHIVPLSEGGSDTPSNMQLIPVEQHKRKTASERTKSSTATNRTPSYRSNSTYNSSGRHSAPSYNTSTGKSTYTGSKGGQYYINSKGNKAYIKKK
jgi:5-methylcytosine-specific restriction endonuclease McrA